MKVHIVDGAEEELNGYLVVNGLSNQTVEGVHANSAQEILAKRCLGKFDYERAGEVLKTWVGKLAHQGEITVGVPDCYEIAQNIQQGNLSIEDCNHLIHSHGCILSMDWLVEKMKESGLQIINKRYHQAYALVKARRL